VAAHNKNRKMEKITTIAMHKNRRCCVVVIGATFETIDDQGGSQGDHETRGAQARTVPRLATDGRRGGPIKQFTHRHTQAAIAELLLVVHCG
jgi:hypothetical protein